MTSRKPRDKIEKSHVTIHGDKWTIEIVPDKTYERRHGKDSKGIMEGHLKRINIPKSNDNKEDLIHEICHAFLYYQSKDDLELTSSEWEEYYCTFFGKNADKIYAVLKELGVM